MRTLSGKQRVGDPVEPRRTFKPLGFNQVVSSDGQIMSFPLGAAARDKFLREQETRRG